MTTPGGTAPPVSPAQGIAAASVALASGVLATIPLPTLPNGGPVPWRTPWLVILNSSPFTLLVSSGGGTVTQIAAFTSDKVYVLATGGARVTVLPIAGSGTAAAGSDSTAYSTWYADEPPGTYPAALGSGSAQLLAPTILVPQTGGVVINAGAVVTFGPFNTNGYGSVLLFAQVSGAQPLRFSLEYPGGSAVTTGLIFIMTSAPGGTNLVILAFPVFGTTVQLRIQNLTAANSAYAVAMSLSPSTARLWYLNNPIIASSNDAYPNMLLRRSPVVVAAASAGTVIGQTLSVWAGPATISLYVPLSDYVIHLQAQDATGAWQDVTEWDSSAGGPAFGTGDEVEMILMPVPYRFTVDNPTGVAATCWVTVIVDNLRVPG